MKKAKVKEEDDWLRDEYTREELGPLVRGKYAASFQKSSNVVVLEPQIAAAFPNDEAVNTALRGLLELAQKSVGEPKKPASRRARTSAR